MKPPWQILTPVTILLGLIGMFAALIKGLGPYPVIACALVVWGVMYMAYRRADLHTRNDLQAMSFLVATFMLMALAGMSIISPAFPTFLGLVYVGLQACAFYIRATEPNQPA